MAKPTFRIPGSHGLTTLEETIVAIEMGMESLFKFAHEIEASACYLHAKPPGVIGKEAGAPKVQSVQRVDERSEKVIATLLPEVQPYARSLIINAGTAGITIKVISGMRTYEEQDRLYAQGRTTPGTIVTKAKAGHSNHNFGIAFDIGVFKGGKYLPESPDYRKVGAIGTGIGLAWGGNWKSFEDQPHFELHPAWAASLSEEQMLKELRDRKESGKAFFI